ncbi:MAG: hypothetical protein H6739_20660 [Alphaproteobacteria bacterium]|nr:hypothetical protein [Alphaproteobacteria bacterium]
MFDDGETQTGMYPVYRLVEEETLLISLLCACVLLNPAPNHDQDGDGMSIAQGDCDDLSPSVYRHAVEVCDDLDNDCDGEIDEEDADLDWSTTSVWFVDADGDGYGDPDQPREACFRSEGLVSFGNDCDDGDSSVHPGAEEVCDDVDNDCDRLTDLDDEDVDLATLRIWYPDEDGDGFGAGGETMQSCDQPWGYVLEGTDCDDTDPWTRPGGTETIDGRDEDCDGRIDNHTAVWDDDGDCYCEAEDCLGSEGHCDGLSGGDCDDRDSAVAPSMEEHCGGTDEDCDGQIDEDRAINASTWWQDGDGDGFGETDSSQVSCTAPSGYVPFDGDCDDGDSTVWPGGTEWCDGIDHDCDGEVNEGDSADARTWYPDGDGDGFGADAGASVSCDEIVGYVSVGGDCDDQDAALEPSVSWYPDADGDGYGEAGASPSVCAPANATDVDDNSDCDDSAVNVYPGATETYADGVDQDCDGADTIWVQVEVGDDDNACALDSNGAVHCWGDDDFGEVSDAPTSHGFVQLSVGGSHACAVDQDDVVHCWGRDTDNESYPPTAAIAQVEVWGTGSCGLLVSDQTVTCWGDDDFGEVSAPAESAMTLIDLASSFGCGLTGAGGAVVCWGSDTYDQVSSTPSGAFTVLSTGYRHACAINASGILSCWGSDGEGQLADLPSTTYRFVDVSVGSSGTTCAVDTLHRVYCWGDSGYLASEPSGSYQSVSVGSDQAACAVGTDGSLTCFGFGSSTVVQEAP